MITEYLPKKMELGVITLDGKSDGKSVVVFTECV